MPYEARTFLTDSPSQISAAAQRTPRAPFEYVIAGVNAGALLSGFRGAAGGAPSAGSVSVAGLEVVSGTDGAGNL